ncbi:MAG TPA: hypothetical protein VM802_02160 [Chitinophaga sp.]|uniref:hypothetical protein n=1 Tax=Chitinophaga sp. TaxID=1869181 RepID=UPI002BACF5D6|nr:hypothetical protein [Chitinophaga sp.]HVI43638.1 hypothetical protein [Chitinophaga sp.]
MYRACACVAVLPTLLPTSGKKNTVVNAVIPKGYKNLVAGEPAGAGVMHYYLRNIGRDYNIIATELTSIVCPDKSFALSSAIESSTTLDFRTTVVFILSAK